MVVAATRSTQVGAVGLRASEPVFTRLLRRPPQQLPWRPRHHPRTGRGRRDGRTRKIFFQGRVLARCNCISAAPLPVPSCSNSGSLIIVFTPTSHLCSEKQHVKDAASSSFSSPLPLQQGTHPALLSQEDAPDARVQGPPLQPRPLRHKEVAGRRGPGGAAGRGDPGAQGEECGARQQVWSSQDRQRWGDGPQGGTAIHLWLIVLEDPLENLGVKLVRQAGARTNDIAGDGCTTSIILAQGLIAEGMKVLAAGMNPVQVARGITKTSDALVSELKFMSREIEDHEIAHVAAVSAGNDYAVGNMISDAFKRVGREGMVRIENGKSTENSLEIVEGMQFERGYLSPYFVTNHANMSAEFTDCKILLVDKIISDPRELLRVCFSAVKEDFPLLIIAEDVEEEALTTLTRNKLSGMIKVAATKAPSFGEQKTQCLEDIAVITGGTVMREDMGYTLEEAGKEVLGSASKVVIKNESTLIVTDGSTLHAVEKRVAQIKGQIENSKERYQKKILGERIARLCGAIAIIQVGAQTVIELKDKKLRMEDALNATMAAIEEGVVVGGGCSLLRLSKKIDIIKESLDNEEQKIGADIFKHALRYPTTLIANNAGISGKFVVEKVLSNDNINYGYNAANDSYEDLMAAGILDPSKVVRCCIEHAAVVAKSFLTSDVVIVEAQESKPVRVRPPMPPRNLIPQMPASVSGIRV